MIPRRVLLCFATPRLPTWLPPSPVPAMIAAACFLASSISGLEDSIVSHLAVYLDDLLLRGESKPWSEFGIGLLPPDKLIHSALVEQDFSTDSCSWIPSRRAIASLDRSPATLCP